jgi:hypothetical protein
MQYDQIWLKAELMKEHIPAFVVTNVLLNTILTMLIENLTAFAYEYYMMR